MNGTDIKKLIVACDMNLNDNIYFNNTRIYNIDEIPTIYVDKNILKKNLVEKYGKVISDYIMMQTYKTDDEKVDPKEILKLIKFE